MFNYLVYFPYTTIHLRLSESFDIVAFVGIVWTTCRVLQHFVTRIIRTAVKRVSLQSILFAISEHFALLDIVTSHVRLPIVKDSKANLLLIRLHSSRMRTARALTVSPSMLCAGGDLFPEGICSRGVPGHGGGVIPACTEADPVLTEWQKPVKT